MLLPELKQCAEQVKEELGFPYANNKPIPKRWQGHDKWGTPFLDFRKANEDVLSLFTLYEQAAALAEAYRKLCIEPNMEKYEWPEKYVDEKVQAMLVNQ